jgi:hypothetical protein
MLTLMNVSTDSWCGKAPGTNPSFRRARCTLLIPGIIPCLKRIQEHGHEVWKTRLPFQDVLVHGLEQTIRQVRLQNLDDAPRSVQRLLLPLTRVLSEHPIASGPVLVHLSRPSLMQLYQLSPTLIESFGSRSCTNCCPSWKLIFPVKCPVK